MSVLVISSVPFFSLFGVKTCVLTYKGLLQLPLLDGTLLLEHFFILGHCVLNYGYG